MTPRVIAAGFPRLPLDGALKIPNEFNNLNNDRIESFIFLNWNSIKFNYYLIDIF